MTGISHLMRNFLSLGNPFVVTLKKSVVRSFVGEHLTQIVLLNCVFTDASKEPYGCAFYVVQDTQRNCSFQKLKLVR